MSISTYVKSCSKTVAGNDFRLYAASFADIDTATFSNGSLTGITLDGSEKFALLETDWDSMTFEANGTAGRGFYSEQSLTAKFSQKTPELDAVIDEIRDAIVCGIVLIRKDGMGQYWISGIAPAEEMGANRPYLSFETNFTSGTTIEEIEDGNVYSVTFGRLSATEEYPLSGSIVNDLNEGTAAFVNYPS